MGIKEFKNTLDGQNPPPDWSFCLQALWWEAKGEWGKAHDLVDGPPGELPAGVHAYLHRKEGDEWNAGYWYRRANKPFPKVSLEEEWRQLVAFHLDN